MVEFSANVKNMRSSEIRRLMKLTADPSIISFAGGMPANELFPIDAVDRIYSSLTREAKQTALQYGPTSGFPPLVESIKSYLQSRGLPLEKQGIIITSGAQQAINILTKVFIDPGDLIVCEYPSFIGAIAAFKSYNANLSAIPIDDNGIDCNALEEELDAHTSQIKMLYLNPYFHNPTGIIYSEERKRELLALLKDRPFVLIEDDPYSELYFDESSHHLTVPLKAQADTSQPICYVGSFAKIFGPGLRLGWLLAPESIIEKCELTKQSLDACASTFTQVLAHEYLAKGELEPYLNYVRPIYARRAQHMLDALDRFMPENVVWTKPRGGFYIWITLPLTVNASEVLNRSITNGAAFVIGSAFDPHGVKNNALRLTFSYTPENQIEKGIAIIADAIKALL